MSTAARTRTALHRSAAGVAHCSVSGVGVCLRLLVLATVDPLLDTPDRRY